MYRYGAPDGGLKAFAYTWFAAPGFQCIATMRWCRIYGSRNRLARIAAIFATRDDGLQIFQILGGLFQKRLDIGRHTAFPFLAQNTGRKPRQPGQPFF